MRARVGEVRVYSHGLGASICIPPRAVSARSVHALGRTPPQSKAQKLKPSTTHTNENEEGGLCEGGLRRNEEESEAGGRIPSSPQIVACPSTRPQAGSARKRRLPRHLGASSHSGNVRGGCRGWTSLATDDQI